MSPLIIEIENRLKNSPFYLVLGIEPKGGFKLLEGWSITDYCILVTCVLGGIEQNHLEIFLCIELEKNLLLLLTGEEGSGQGVQLGCSRDNIPYL